MGGVATGVHSRAGGQVPDEGVEPLPRESGCLELEEGPGSRAPRGEVGVHGGDCTEGWIASWEHPSDCPGAEWIRFGLPDVDMESIRGPVQVATLEGEEFAAA